VYLEASSEGEEPRALGQEKILLFLYVWKEKEN